MKNICFCFQMHAPYSLKRYRFFEIGQDHYYYDDMQTEDHVASLIQTSYMPLCHTIAEMIRLSKGRFHCAISVSGIMLEMFEQFAPEMIDTLKELAETKCVEFVVTPYAYSLANVYSDTEAAEQLLAQQKQVEKLLGVESTTACLTELLYSDEIAIQLHQMGFKTVMTEGAKHILSWKSPNYVYSSSAAPKLKVLLRNTNLSDELAFHFSDPAWHNFPMNAEAYAIGMANLPEEEQVANIWVGAETFGMRQNAETGIFDFLKALPYFAMEQGMGFMTPGEVAKKFAANDAIVAAHPLTWAGEAKDLSTYNGNDLQQEALNKLYAVAERVHLCQDKQLKEYGDKIPAEKKSAIEGALAKLKEAHKSADVAAIDTAIAELNAAWQAASQDIYAQQQAEQAQQGAQQNAGAQGGAEQKAQPEDVEFEEVK